MAISNIQFMKRLFFCICFWGIMSACEVREQYQDERRGRRALQDSIRKADSLAAEALRDSVLKQHPELQP